MMYRHFTSDQVELTPEEVKAIILEKLIEKNLIGKEYEIKDFQCFTDGSICVTTKEMGTQSEAKL